MPHFTLQVSPSGPLVDAFIGVSQARNAALIAANHPVPNVVRIRGLIDTGASCTAIDPSVLQSLGLTPTGSTLVNTPSTGNQPHIADEYDVSIFIPGSQSAQPAFALGTIGVVSAELLMAQGFHALIGCDILAHCILIYNGAAGIFTIAY